MFEVNAQNLQLTEPGAFKDILAETAVLSSFILYFVQALCHKSYTNSRVL